MAMRRAMRTSPAAFAEGLGAWLVPPGPDMDPGAKELHLEAAEVAAQTFAEILLVSANYMTQGNWGK